MIRKHLRIRPHQEIRLKEISRDRGISESEIIRQAIDAYLSGDDEFIRDVSAWERERAFIESLIERGPVEGERTWKRSDLY